MSVSMGIPELLNDIDVTGECCCAGCIGMGPCDLGASCNYGCSAITFDGRSCARCEAEATGSDLEIDAAEPTEQT